MNDLFGMPWRREPTARPAFRHHRGRAAVAAASGAVALAALAACSSSSSGSSSSAALAGSTASSSASASVAGSASASGSAAGVAHAQQQLAEYEKPATSFPAPGPALDAAKVAALKGKTVLFVPDGLAGPFVLGQQGVEAGFAHLGITVKTCDPNFLPTEVAACFGEAKTDGAIGVITSGIPYNLAADAYQALEAEHIPVLVSAAGPGNPADNSDLAFETGNASTTLAGTLSADQVIADSDGNANVLFVGASGATGVDAQFTATLAEFKTYCPDCTVTAVSFDAANTSQITSSVSSKLISDSPTYLLSQADAYMPYILPAVQTGGFAAKVKIVSETGAPEVLSLVQEQHGVLADPAFDSVYIGWDAVDGLLRLITGVSVPADPYVPVRVFTAANLAGVHLSTAMNVNPLFGSESFEQMFFRLWAGQQP